MKDFHVARYGWKFVTRTRWYKLRPEAMRSAPYEVYLEVAACDIWWGVASGSFRLIRSPPYREMVREKAGRPSLPNQMNARPRSSPHASSHWRSYATFARQPALRPRTFQR